MGAIQRIKQFYLSVFDKINQDDIYFIDKYLSQKEKNVFFKLSKSEQKHSVRVAKALEVDFSNIINSSFDKDTMVKIGLLHDIGKMVSRINPIEKSLLVLLDLFTKGKLRRYSTLKKVKVFYYHGELGSNILKDLGYSEKFINVIKNHHNLKYKDYDVILLRNVDDKN